MTSVYDFSATAIDGAETALEQYRGQALLIVNTASKCGFTGQYLGLQEIWRHYKDRDLIVLGVPSNDFGGQEPGPEKEIREFCDSKYHVTFPMTAKVDVKGDDAHPFYKWAVDQVGEPAEPVWNFHKLLVGKDGALINVFGPRTDPQDPETKAAIEAAL